MPVEVGVLSLPLPLPLPLPTPLPVGSVCSGMVSILSAAIKCIHGAEEEEDDEEAEEEEERLRALMVDS